MVFEVAVCFAVAIVISVPILLVTYIYCRWTQENGGTTNNPGPR